MLIYDEGAREREREVLELRPCIALNAVTDELRRLTRNNVSIKYLPVFIAKISRFSNAVG
jgi:hypothetical protein